MSKAKSEVVQDEVVQDEEAAKVEEPAQYTPKKGSALMTMAGIKVYGDIISAAILSGGESTFDELIKTNTLEILDK